VIVTPADESDRDCDMTSKEENAQLIELENLEDELDESDLVEQSPSKRTSGRLRLLCVCLVLAMVAAVCSMKDAVVVPTTTVSNMLSVEVLDNDLCQGQPQEPCNLMRNFGLVFDPVFPAQSQVAMDKYVPSNVNFVLALDRFQYILIYHQNLGKRLKEYMSSKQVSFEMVGVGTWKMTSVNSREFVAEHPLKMYVNLNFFTKGAMQIWPNLLKRQEAGFSDSRTTTLTNCPAGCAGKLSLKIVKQDNGASSSWRISEIAAIRL